MRAQALHLPVTCWVTLQNPFPSLSLRFLFLHFAGVDGLGAEMDCLLCEVCPLLQADTAWYI